MKRTFRIYLLLAWTLTSCSLKPATQMMSPFALLTAPEPELYLQYAPYVSVNQEHSIEMGSTIFANCTIDGVPVPHNLMQYRTGSDQGSVIYHVDCEWPNGTTLTADIPIVYYTDDAQTRYGASMGNFDQVRTDVSDRCEAGKTIAKIFNYTFGSGESFTVTSLDNGTAVLTLSYPGHPEIEHQYNDAPTVIGQDRAFAFDTEATDHRREMTRVVSCATGLQVEGSLILH